jgi:hypothetical protein
MLKTSVGRDTSQKLKGVPPGISAFNGNEFSGGMLEDTPVNIFWTPGDSDRALATSPRIGVRILGTFCRAESHGVYEKIEAAFFLEG